MGRAAERNGGRRRWGVALACLLLAGCFWDRPPAMTKTPPAPMVTPQPPPSSPEFNAANARPLPVPEPPAFSRTPSLTTPGAGAALVPLPNPEPLALTPAPTVAAEPTPPPQMSKPIPRPTGGPAPVIEETEPAPAPVAAQPAAVAPPPVVATEDALAPGGIRLLFKPGSAELPAASASLLHDLVDTLGRTPQTRFRLLAYASGDKENPVPARRLSLQRALKVREALAGEGIANARVDVLPLGLTAAAPPLDRVDLIPVP